MKTVNRESVSGAELVGRGYTLAAKVSLWESQSRLINRILDWADKSRFLWEWFETVYEAADGEVEKCEISVIFFLKDTEKDSFLSAFPDEGKHCLRLEPFDDELFDYYSKNGIHKHPRTN